MFVTNGRQCKKETRKYDGKLVVNAEESKTNAVAIFALWVIKHKLSIEKMSFELKKQRCLGGDSKKLKVHG